MWLGKGFILSGGVFTLEGRPLGQLATSWGPPTKIEEGMVSCSGQVWGVLGRWPQTCPPDEQCDCWRGKFPPQSSGQSTGHRVLSTTSGRPGLNRGLVWETKLHIWVNLELKSKVNLGVLNPTFLEIFSHPKQYYDFGAGDNVHFLCRKWTF